MLNTAPLRAKITLFDEKYSDAVSPAAEPKKVPMPMRLSKKPAAYPFAWLLLLRIYAIEAA